MRRKQRKLVLSRETLQRLDDLGLEIAKGAATALCTRTTGETECSPCPHTVQCPLTGTGCL
jgi:ribosomal protein RSM22 (predicted rRNA methylase)